MSDAVDIRFNVATATEIADHLALADDAFLPPLGERVAIGEYALKIASRAERFEAWTHGALVGLVAAYCNDPDASTAYITNVSVVPAYRKRGLASRLLVECVAFARHRHLRRISLEVDRENEPAIELYKGKGFTVASISGRTMRMELDTREDTRMGTQS